MVILPLLQTSTASCEAKSPRKRPKKLSGIHTEEILMLPSSCVSKGWCDARNYVLRYGQRRSLPDYFIENSTGFRPFGRSALSQSGCHGLTFLAAVVEEHAPSALLRHPLCISAEAWKQSLMTPAEERGIHHERYPEVQVRWMFWI